MAERGGVPVCRLAMGMRSRLAAAIHIHMSACARSPLTMSAVWAPWRTYWRSAALATTSSSSTR
eukprot:535103-Pleurochrysis_carterae.AAC.1